MATAMSLSANSSPRAIPPSLPASMQSNRGLRFLPSFNTQPVARLLQYRVEGGDDYSKTEKEVKSLFKKIKKKGCLQELEKALSSNGSIPTGCVTIPYSADRTADGPSRTWLPHVVYCRIWRWPDLQNQHELKPTHVCVFSYNHKKEEVCVNPYHYNRIMKPHLPPVLVPNKAPPSSLPQAPFEPQTDLPQNKECPSIDSLPAEETPPPAYSEVALSIDSPAGPSDQSVYSGVGSPIMSPCPSSIASMGSPVQPGVDVKPIMYTEPAYWCSIYYHEMAVRVGEAFQASRSSITVDGGTDPCTMDRFCLGLHCHVNRDPSTIQARRHIGQGVRLVNVGGEVYIECLGPHSVFVQSPNANLRNQWDFNTVVKVPPGCMLNSFNSQDFARRLTDAVHLGYEAVVELQKMCVIRLSFIKGWGADYRRSQVSSTPCWIQIDLHGPMQWLDKVLTHMGCPHGVIHSDT